MFVCRKKNNQLMAETERQKERESTYIHASIVNSPTHLYRAKLKVRSHLLLLYTYAFCSNKVRGKIRF